MNNLTRKQTKEKLLEEFHTLVEKYQLDNSMSYIIALLDFEDDIDMFSATMCARCAVARIVESLDAKGIVCNSEIEKLDKVH